MLQSFSSSHDCFSVQTRGTRQRVPGSCELRSSSLHESSSSVQAWGTRKRVPGSRELGSCSFHESSAVQTWGTRERVPGSRELGSSRRHERVSVQTRGTRERVPGSSALGAVWQPSLRPSSKAFNRENFNGNSKDLQGHLKGFKGPPQEREFSASEPTLQTDISPSTDYLQTNIPQTNISTNISQPKFTGTQSSCVKCTEAQPLRVVSRCMPAVPKIRSTNRLSLVAESNFKSCCALHSSCVKCTEAKPLRVATSPMPAAARIRSTNRLSLVAESGFGSCRALPGHIFTQAREPAKVYGDRHEILIKNLTCKIDDQLSECDSWQLFPFLDVSEQAGLHGKAEAEPTCPASRFRTDSETNGNLDTNETLKSFNILVESISKLAAAVTRQSCATKGKAFRAATGQAVEEHEPSSLAQAFEKARNN